MARSHQKTNTLGEQVAQLAAQVQQLRAELEDARGGGHGSNGHDAEPRSRRDLLRMAGVAAVGAAGALVVRGTPAHAVGERLRARRRGGCLRRDRCRDSRTVPPGWDSGRY